MAKLSTFYRAHGEPGKRGKICHCLEETWKIRNSHYIFYSIYASPGKVSKSKLVSLRSIVDSPCTIFHKVAVPFIANTCELYQFIKCYSNYL